MVKAPKPASNVLGIKPRRGISKHPKDTLGYQVVHVRQVSSGLTFQALGHTTTYQEALWMSKSAKAALDYQDNHKSWVKILEVTTSGQIWCEAVYLASQKPTGPQDAYVTLKGWE